jgi:MerR family copper efflux transcriptional regulator
MKIGEVAKCTGVSIDALRFYEEKGLLSPIGRTDSGYRIYDESVLSQVSFIKTAQELGFSLLEIGEILPGLAKGSLRVEELRAALHEKLGTLDVQIKRLTALREQVLFTLGSLKCDAQSAVNAKELMGSKASTQGDSKKRKHPIN